jgi:hypothetical protein
LTEIVIIKHHVVAGAGVVTGGVALTLFTGAAGASLIGQGSQLMMKPIKKRIKGECMSLRGTVKDAVFASSKGSTTALINILNFNQFFGF